MAKLNPSNIYSESRDVFSSILKANLIDPKRGVANSNRRWFYRDEPDTTARDFDGYPTLVIDSPDLSDSPEDLNGATSDTQISFNIELATEYNDVNSRIDQLSSQIYGLFKSFYVLNQFATNNMYEPDIESSPTATVTRDQKRLHVRNFVITFRTTQEAS